MTLTEFLLSRIAEDEEWAKRAEDPITPLYDWFDRARVDEDLGPADPARVLAECEAKRRIMDRFTWDDLPHEETSDPMRVLRIMAAVYADHPDYRRQEWKP